MNEREGRKYYVKLRLKLAREKIRVAEILLANKEYRDVISRAYYSVFYAARAFLLHRGDDPSSHKGVDILIHRSCAEHEKPSAAAARILSLMRQARLDADYKENIRVTHRDASEAVDMAKTFLKEIRSLIRGT